MKGQTIYLQCGFEDDCKKKDCINCPMKEKKELVLTHAEKICIEDFAVGDLDCIDNKIRELMQDVMVKLMKKVYRERI